MRGSEPPRCAAHSGLVGAPAGNQNRRTHGAYARPRKLETLADVIADLQSKIARLSELIDKTDDVDQVHDLIALYAQMASRLGRLLRDQRALDGKAADGLLDAIGTALDEISTELGIKL